MKLQASLGNVSLDTVPAIAQAAEALGLDMLWTNETQHDPFLPHVPAAQHTERLRLGTAVAIAFARSPTVIAQTAWDLATVSHGRFVLGLGTQVKAHVERRFGMPWSAPVPRLREYIQAVRALWHTWQTGERLNFRGEHYQLTLMTPFFSPPPLDVPPPPIYIAGVGAPLCRLAGELADGFLLHPFHTRHYLDTVTVPAIRAGAVQAGREAGAVDLVATTFFVPSGDSAAEAQVRAQIAFYASTPSYRGVLAAHGWEGAGEELSALAARGQWGRMPAVVTDEMLGVFALSGTWDQLPDLLRERYGSLVEHVGLYMPFEPGAQDEIWSRLARALAGD